MAAGDPRSIAEENGSGGEAEGRSWTGRLGRGLLLAFCCWHAAFLVCSIIPAPPAQATRGNPATDFYRVALSGREQWNMFDTIPVLHSMDLRLEGEDAKGNKTTSGCLLPGFKSYPKPEDSRYYVLFFRLMFYDDMVPYREAYLRKVAELLEARRTPGAAEEKWSLVTDAAFTRNLFYSRRDGQTVVPKTFDFAIRGGGDK